VSAPAATAQLRLGRRAYPVVRPSVRDPRLHLAAVIVTLQVLGQTAFDFDLSIAQILVSVLTCAVLEVVITLHRRGVLAWPASAMLTGNGVAFILRVPGTEHGDWWSMRGAWIFAATAAVSLLSKYLIRVRGHHVFNPSNFGLVLCFLLLGPARVEPLDFWWAPMGPALALALLVIVVGGLLITSRVGMLGVAASFWLTFAAALGLVAAAGHCMTARWHLGPICDGEFWTVLVTSPEVLVFLFFMITDPKTAPRGAVARYAYGVAVALTCALLVAPQRTEYATKVAVLSGLALVCAVRPLAERWFPAPGGADDDVRAWLARVGAHGRRVGRAALGVAGFALCAVALVAAGTPARTHAEVATGSLGARAVDVPLDAVPPITLDPSLESISSRLSRADAVRVVRDVVADLVIAGDALELRDSALAATGSRGPFRTRVERAIARADRTDRLVVPRYELDHATLLVVRDGTQGTPQLGVELRGHIRRTSYDGLRPPVVSDRTIEPFHHTYSLYELDGHHLLFDDARRATR
jgi:Na+-transporting NADH:ubiquinone oxidoreductase subunit NqrB